jgi:hypothetical protein
MLPNRQRGDTNSANPPRSIAEVFGLPTEQFGSPLDTPPVAPPRSSPLRAALSWLCWFIVDGFAVCGCAMYPYFVDPSDQLDSLYPQRRQDAERSTVAQRMHSPWDFDNSPGP